MVTGHPQTTNSGRVRALGLSSELQKHLLRELSSAVFHLKNDLIVGELRCVCVFFRWITAIDEFRKP